MPSSRQHAGPATAGRAPVPEPSLAERARTLLHLGRLGTLATHSRKQPGFPFGSVMPYATDEHGRPVFLISSMAMHTQNLKADPRASLLVAAETDGDPLGGARASLLGEVHPAPEGDSGRVRELYLTRHETARSWVEFNDFEFFRMEPVDLYFVGGFGVMGWVTAEEYARATPDPLVETAPQILRHMNTDHGESLVRLARAAGEGDADTAVMTAIDRLGFHLKLRSGERIHGIRMAFPREARTTSEVRRVLVEMVQSLSVVR